MLKDMCGVDNNEYTLSGNDDDEHLITLKQNKTVLPVNLHLLFFSLSVH